MDALIIAAARALARGDPLGALKGVALRNDASALALRGIAMAQLGELPRARELLRKAGRAFGAGESLARARCVLAETEVALASRDLAWATRHLEAAREVLVKHGDTANAAHAGYLLVRHQLLVGRIADAERAMQALPRHVPLPLRVTHQLIRAQLALRRLQTGAARAALKRAEHLALQAGITALSAEVAAARAQLEMPAARLLSGKQERVLKLREVEGVLQAHALVIDGLRHAVRLRGREVALATRPVLLALVRALAQEWPADVSREALVRCAFRLRRADESARARLRVEIGRLRRALDGMATIAATPRGYLLQPLGTRQVLVLARPTEDEAGEVLALLSDGEAWSTSSLAEALHTSQRTIQRALDGLARAGKVQASGRGRALRWTGGGTPGFTTLLLLPSTLPST